MFDAANARRLMVEGQVRTADVTDAAVLDAMLTLPRERFLPPSLAPLAYLDGDIPGQRPRAEDSRAKRRPQSPRSGPEISG
jgi:protein-L-isoaspartate O-methyltransferase